MDRQDLYKNILVIGGNVAGLAAASQAKRVNPDAELTVLESGKYISYGSCGLPYYITGQIKEFDDIFAYPPDFFEKKRNIKVLLDHRVTGLDTPSKQVIVNSQKKIGYDRLIICSGASPRPLDIPGAGSQNVFNFWNVADTVKVKDFILSRNPQKAVVVGAGSVGLLMAEAFSTLGIDVTMVELSGKILNEYEDEISNIVYKTLALKGIDVVLSAMVTSFVSGKNNTVSSVLVNRGSETVETDTDMVLLSAGVKPNTDFIAGSSIELDPNGAVKVAGNLQTSRINIFAAGDCATVKNLVTGKNDHIPTANNAAKTGRIAGANAAGANISFKGSVKTKVDKFFGLEIAKTGIDTSEARTLGFEPLKISGSYPSHVKAVGGTETITTTLTVDPKTRRILGAQMVGRDCISKRIDIFAAALTAEMSVDDVYMFDLSYAPKVSTVWDPVNKIAGKAVLELDRKRF
ncbi:MAG: FAD-dependent oxidoreductase [Actinomycetota bacterium]